MCERIHLLACDMTGNLQREAECEFEVGYQIFDGLVVAALVNL